MICSINSNNSFKGSSNSFNGSIAEDTLYNLLSEKLMLRDGFSVTKVNGKSHSCDILVQREDFPDISIESKAHGQNTGEKVRTKEIEKFERDLHELDNHGIFVSIYNEIVGKGSLEIKQLPNAKFAITGAQLNWSTREIECYSIYFSCKTFEDLLDNRHFILKTDHMNLTYLNVTLTGKVQ